MAWMGQIQMQMKLCIYTYQMCYCIDFQHSILAKPKQQSCMQTSRLSGAVLHCNNVVNKEY